MPSSVIRGMRYDPERRELLISFRAQREVYVYEQVPPEEWMEFRSAGSKGTYLNHVFKAREHPYRRLKERGREDPARAVHAEGDEALKWGETWAIPHKAG